MVAVLILGRLLQKMWVQKCLNLYLWQEEGGGARLVVVAHAGAVVLAVTKQAKQYRGL